MGQSLKSRDGKRYRPALTLYNSDWTKMTMYSFTGLTQGEVRFLEKITF
jgi:hypothetical protein